MEETPKELDWVSERAKCEIDRAFADLALAVKSDVEIINAELKLKPDYQIGIREDGSGWGFAVFRRSNIPKTVTFTRTNSHIRISFTSASGDATALTGAPVFTKSGYCKFEVGDKEIEQWQLRRLALEELFFGNPWG